ncbi:hypothetical protein BCR32DRAFT_283802 [Anaeromyces robustus]|uniref:Endonuclease/exonuclease/phosphatase domain-containing protein n=1 Tax=Anaeromyces robustus TaxID=1754192 RepID=A0A1Y1WUI0_9FUNG|nr:hypothetical protein BCR32DRAFT_283802 [Anaeromyces robustus]|eukprot:ORX76794.1 hypothetical protein BCR32DRAFT_283802 [Anaeromyces robustus]
MKNNVAVFYLTSSFYLKGKSTLEKLFLRACPCYGEKTSPLFNQTKSLGFSKDSDENYEDNIIYITLMLNAFLDGGESLLFPDIMGLSHFLTVVMRNEHLTSDKGSLGDNNLSKEGEEQQKHKQIYFTTHTATFFPKLQTTQFSHSYHLNLKKIVNWVCCDDLFSYFLNPNGKCFNICACWNINGWNFEKKDSISYLNHVFFLNLLVFAFRKLVQVNFFQVAFHLLTLSRTRSLYISESTMTLTEIRGLYIGVHSSCSFTSEPLLYNYILSVNLTSFWGKNVLLATFTSRKRDGQKPSLLHFDELEKWLKFHSKDNYPAVLMGDFNMSRRRLNNYISKSFPIWIINLMYLYLYPKKKSTWSKHICNTKTHDILTHNYFEILAADLESNMDEFSTDEMINKFVETLNKVGKNIKSFHPCKIERIKKIKSKIRAARYKANIISIGNHFLKKEYRLGWRDLKKLAKPSYSKTPSHVIKSKFGNDIVSPREQISRWAEHYKRSCF